MNYINNYTNSNSDDRTTNKSLTEYTLNKYKRRDGMKHNWLIKILEWNRGDDRIIGIHKKKSPTRY